MKYQGNRKSRLFLAFTQWESIILNRSVNLDLDLGAFLQPNPCRSKTHAEAQKARLCVCGGTALLIFLLGNHRNSYILRYHTHAVTKMPSADWHSWKFFQERIPNKRRSKRGIRHGERKHVGKRDESSSSGSCELFVQSDCPRTARQEMERWAQQPGETELIRKPPLPFTWGINSKVESYTLKSSGENLPALSGEQRSWRLKFLSFLLTSSLAFCKQQALSENV